MCGDVPCSSTGVEALNAFEPPPPMGASDVPVGGGKSTREPILGSQAGDIFEMRDISGCQNQVVAQRGGGDQ